IMSIFVSSLTMSSYSLSYFYRCLYPYLKIYGITRALVILCKRHHIQVDSLKPSNNFSVEKHHMEANDVYQRGSNSSTKSNDTAPSNVASSPNFDTTTGVCFASVVNPRDSMTRRIAGKIKSFAFVTPPPNTINSGLIA